MADSENGADWRPAMTKGESLIRDGMSRKERRGKARGGKKRNGCDGHRCRFVILTKSKNLIIDVFRFTGKLGPVGALQGRVATTGVGARGALQDATVKEVGLAQIDISVSRSIFCARGLT